jgi:hypothetical protein
LWSTRRKSFASASEMGSLAGGVMVVMDIGSLFEGRNTIVIPDTPQA